MRVNSLGITEGVCIWELLRLQTCNTLRLKLVNGEISEVLEFCIEPLVNPNLEQHNKIPTDPRSDQHHRSSQQGAWWKHEGFRAGSGEVEFWNL